MTENDLITITEVSTTADADTTRVTVEAGEHIVLAIEGPEGRRATYLTANEAKRLAKGLLQAEDGRKQSGTVIIDGDSDHVTGYQR